MFLVPTSLSLFNHASLPKISPHPVTSSAAASSNRATEVFLGAGRPVDTSVQFCVAIRTYNGERHLPEILTALQQQVGLADIRWEVLVVDNCSTDRTAAIIRTYQKNWSLDCPLRYVYEPRQGSSFARRRAIEEAQAPLIGFLDDDNIPHPTWVSAAIAFAKSHPQAVAFGSQIHGRFEVSPPPGFERIAGFIPIVERPESLCFTEGHYDRINMLPPGAGLVIQRQAWLDHVPQTLTLKGPVGTSLALKGEDIEALLYIKRSGGEIWFNADMHIDHHIPPSRLERSYLLRFFKGVGLSRAHTRALTCRPWLRPWKLSLFAINDLRKLMLHLVSSGPGVHRDLVTACEFQLRLYSFLGILQMALSAFAVRNPNIPAEVHVCPSSE